MFRLIPALAVLFATVAVAAEVPKETKAFIDKAAVSNKYEIDTSELAKKYGQAADVKTFAQQMITDHQKIGQDFKAALAEANIEISGRHARRHPYRKVCQATPLHDGGRF